MRPINDHNSDLKNPLNRILGFQANIRLLRCLIEAQEAMSNSELADRTGLSLPGIHKVVPRMIKTGIIQYTGSGKKQQIEIRNNHPLASAIKELFKAEQEYYDSLIESLKELMKGLELKPKSAWIFGKIAQGSDEYGDPVRIALLGDVKNIDEITDQFRDRLLESGIEKEFDVTIEIRGGTLADLATLNVKDIIMLWGPDPQHYSASSKNERHGNRTHENLDRKALMDSKAWTELLRTYPEIIQRTIKYLEDRIPQISSGEKKELQEWKHILESMSFQRLKKFLESDSERSTRLHQSLPFWPVLKDSERTKLKNYQSEQNRDSVNRY